MYFCCVSGLLMGFYVPSFVFSSIYTIISIDYTLVLEYTLCSNFCCVPSFIVPPVRHIDMNSLTTFAFLNTHELLNYVRVPQYTLLVSYKFVTFVLMTYFSPRIPSP